MTSQRKLCQKRKLCPACTNGLMRIQKGRRGFYYRCDDCAHVINNFEPIVEADEPEPVSLKFQVIGSNAS